MMTRGRFLRAGSALALGAAVLPAPALAALPAPAPQGDDEGFLQFGALAERTGMAFYTRAAGMRGTWSAAERRRLKAAHGHKADHFARLVAALGADAPDPSEFSVRLPATAFRTRRGALELGRRLEGLMTGVYVEAVALVADPATRLLVGRLLAADAQLLSQLRELSGLGPGGMLPDPVDLEQAGPQLDRFLQANGYPTL